MKRDFVPFAAKAPMGAPTVADSRTQVLTDAKQVMSFQPLAQAAAMPPKPAAGHGEPTVSFEREGGRVTRIKIHCPCGNDIELMCDYGQPPAA
jgi:hypothetical protein